MGGALRKLFSFLGFGKAKAPGRGVSKLATELDAAQNPVVQPSGNTPTDVPLNDCVHQLYKPAEGSPSVDIVFFHGLQLGGYENAWRSTWVNSDGVFWPQAWLAQDFPNARILSVSYDSCANRWFGATGNMDMQDIGNYLVQQLVCANKVRLGEGNRPVVLVGHSLGGIVLKQLFVEAATQGAHNTQQSAKCRQFEGNLAGAFFYATPHGGSGLAGLAEATFTVFGGASPVLQYLKVLSKDAARLNLDFANRIRDRQGLDLVAVYETKPTKGVEVVKAAAAMQGMHRAVAAPMNHNDICKPEKDNDMCYSMLVDYITDTLKVSQFDVEDVAGFGVEELLNSILGPPGSPEATQACSRLGPSGIAIWGAGGMGKSMLAKALFNRCSPDFVCGQAVKVMLPFAATNDEGVSSGLYEAYLQQMGCTKGRTHSLKERLAEGRVLLLLDNCSNQQQLHDILPVGSWLALGPGSYVIMTTRNEDLAQHFASLLPGIQLYSMPGMSDAAARELLRSIASPPADLIPALEKLERKIIKRCGGMPLAVELVGGALKGEGVDTWQVAYEKLKTGFLEWKKNKNRNIGSKLENLIKWSAAGLPDKAEEMFYDAATVLGGELECTVLMMWGARYCADADTVESWLGRLKGRCLLSCKNDGRLWVHDVLVMVARDILKNGARHGSRMWSLEPLQHQKLLPEVQLLRGLGGQLDCEMLPQLTKLEVVLDATAEEPSSSSGQVVPAMKWLRSKRFSMSIVPQLTQLVVLDLAGNYRLAVLPAACSQLRHLQHLDISHCSGLTDAAPVAALAELRLLDASGCIFLKSIPDLSKLQKLQRLYLRSCQYLQHIPGLGQLQSLLHLDCSGCRRLSDITGLDQLPKLTMLLLSGCDSIQQVPDLSRLAALKGMDLKGCSLISCPNLAPHTQLTTLKLGFDIQGTCDAAIQDLPTWLQQLKAPNTLGEAFTQLFPVCVQDVSPLFNLQQLHELDCSDCRLGSLSESIKLQAVGPQLEALCLYGVDYHGAYHAFRRLTKLGVSARPPNVGSSSNDGGTSPQRRLGSSSSGSSSSSSSNVQDKSGSSSTADRKAFEAAAAATAAAVPEWLCSLQRLTRLELGAFSTLPSGLGQLPQLQELHIERMQHLKHLPASTTELRSLRQLTVQMCPLRRLPENISALSALQVLRCRRCELKKLPGSFSGLAALQVLSFAGCSKLTSLQGLQHSANLQTLDLQYINISQSDEVAGYIPDHLESLGTGLWRSRYTTADTADSPDFGLSKLASGSEVGPPVPLVAPEGRWIQQWKVWYAESGVVSIQGIPNEGMPLDPLVGWRDTTDVNSTVVAAPTEQGCTSLHGRCGFWLDSFMGYGNAIGGDEFTFHCPAGHHVVGYKGKAGEFVGRISFITRRF